ncbi:recombination-associated protein RdgC [Endozoicomonas lisbonensis]|uniref:Recombination-associated protein RdgC n=1 Tax=Endozoicomonas lisbonensis TaxID=3120522 RepID=A0ABV2SQF1_9GAMM
MLFKNARIYCFQKDFDLLAMVKGLKEKRFVECNAFDLKSTGWVPPSKASENFLALPISNDAIVLCLQHQERPINSKAVKQEVARRVAVLEQEQDRQIFRAEKQQISDDVMAVTAPNVLPVTTQIYGLILPNKGLLVVAASSNKQADLFIKTLRLSCGSLPVALPVTKSHPEPVMTNWLTMQAPESMILGNNCKLNIDNSAVTVKNEDVTSSAVIEHIESGMKVSELELLIMHKCSFVLTSELYIKRIHLDDVVTEPALEAETTDESFHAEMLINAQVVAEIFDKVCLSFNGLEGPAEQPVNVDQMTEYQRSKD